MKNFTVKMIGKQVEGSDSYIIEKLELFNSLPSCCTNVSFCLVISCNLSFAFINCSLLWSTDLLVFSLVVRSGTLSCTGLSWDATDVSVRYFDCALLFSISNLNGCRNNSDIFVDFDCFSVSDEMLLGLTMLDFSHRSIFLNFAESVSSDCFLGIKPCSIS